MAKPREGYEQVAVTIPIEVATRLRVRAAERRVPLGTVVHEALALYLGPDTKADEEATTGVHRQPPRKKKARRSR